MFFDEIKDFIQYNESKVKIQFDEKNDMVSLSYYPGDGFLLTLVSFRPSTFFYLINFLDKHEKDYYSHFAESLINGVGINDSGKGNIDDLTILLQYWNINKTLLSRICRHRKGIKSKKRLDVSVRKSEVDKLIYGKSFKGGSRVKSYGEIDLSAQMKCVDWMNKCVLRSAQEFSLQYFEEFKCIYLDWMKASGLRSPTSSSDYCSRKLENKIFKIYVQKVKSLQKY